MAALTPQDIRTKQFTTVRLKEGYDEDDVDAFLDEIVADYTEWIRRAMEAEAQVAALMRKLSGDSTVQLPVVEPPAAPVPATAVGPSVESVNLLLNAAQQAADQLKAEAQVKATTTVTQAQAQAQQVLAQAQQDADQQRAQATVSAQATLAAAEQQRQDIAGKVQALQVTHGDVVGRLQAAITALGSLEGQAS